MQEDSQVVNIFAYTRGPVYAHNSIATATKALEDPSSSKKMMAKWKISLNSGFRTFRIQSIKKYI